MDYKAGREFLKFHYPKDENHIKTNPLADNDQSRGIEMPIKEKSFLVEELIVLPNPKGTIIVNDDFFSILNNRKSRREFSNVKLNLNEVSFILWAMQGLRLDNNSGFQRTVPSAGARNPFDTYFYAANVEGLPVGLYRYIWSKHGIVPVSLTSEQRDGFSQEWEKGAISVFFVVVPYRSEWRYMNYAHKFCALDAGHIAQNGYLAAEALQIGCYAIGGYSQEDVDRLIGIDGENEFTCYIETFGKYTE